MTKTKITLGWAELYQYLFLNTENDEPGITVLLTVFVAKNKGWQTHWMMTIEMPQ